MRKRLKILGYEISMCVERSNHLLPHNQANQVFHADFNIYNNKGDKKQ